MKLRNISLTKFLPFSIKFWSITKEMNFVRHQQQQKIAEELEIRLEATCIGGLSVSHRLELRSLIVDLCCSTNGFELNRLENKTVFVARESLTKFKNNLKRRKFLEDKLTSSRIMALNKAARDLLLSKIAYIFRDTINDWSEINFNNKHHVRMLDQSLTLSLHALKNPQGRPCNKSLDKFFIKLRDLYTAVTKLDAQARAHYDNQAHTDFEQLLYLGYKILRPAQTYPSALKAYERAISRKL